LHWWNNDALIEDEHITCDLQALQKLLAQDGSPAFSTVRKLTLNRKTFNVIYFGDRFDFCMASHTDSFFLG